MELSQVVSQMESGSRLRHRSVKHVQNYRYSTGLMRGAAGRPHGSWRRFNIQSSICNAGARRRWHLQFNSALLYCAAHHRPSPPSNSHSHSRRVESPFLPAIRHHTDDVDAHFGLHRYQLP